jgi:hypothetical protein
MQVIAAAAVVIVVAIEWITGIGGEAEAISIWRTASRIASVEVSVAFAIYMSVMSGDVSFMCAM